MLADRAVAVSAGVEIDTAVMLPALAAPLTVSVAADRPVADRAALLMRLAVTDAAVTNVTFEVDAEIDVATKLLTVAAPLADSEPNEAAAAVTATAVRLPALNWPILAAVADRPTVVMVLDTS